MYQITLQRVVKFSFVPTIRDFKKWVQQTLIGKIDSAEVNIRIVDKNEITNLNASYRKKNKPTNVLSFPIEIAEDIKLDPEPLGDIVICAEVIAEEAKDQHKPIKAHWAHMVVHGTLHLLGYDHIKIKEAEKMEHEEIRILSQLGFNNPYSMSRGSIKNG